MSFLDPLYALFLLATIECAWLLRQLTSQDKVRNNLQLWLFLVTSIVFYTSLQWWYIPLLLTMALLNFYLGKAMEEKASIGIQQAQDQNLSNQEWESLQQSWNRKATNLLILGIVANILVLVVFKYLPFLLNTFSASFNSSSASEGANWLRKNLLAPLGISFFTFECIAYLVDISRGSKASQNLLQFISYKLFFPKLISGPITRYHEITQQFNSPQAPALNNFIEGFWLIALGAVKKALIADRLGIFVDLCFGNLERAGSVDIWLAVVAYGLQLYFDFSGYVDLARGSAMLLGFNLPENFNYPYFSTSIADFWRRWHMTLGDWLRNYLYFPLGGSRQGLGRTCLNLLLVMVIAGIWHGAAWGYVVWGGLHGLALAIHRLTDAVSKEVEGLAVWWKSLPGVFTAWLITQLMVFSSWIFFRLPDLRQAGLAVSHLWNYSGDAQFAQKVYGEAIGLGQYQVSVLIALLFTAMAIAYSVQQGLKLRLNWPVKLIFAPLYLLGVWLLAPEGGLPYIYFDF